MTHFNESSEYWGDRAQKIMGASNGRLTARSVKIFADGTYLASGIPLNRRKEVDMPFNAIGALRTGGAAVGTLPLTSNSKISSR